MTIKHLVFDFDGVLADGTNDAYFRCYEKAVSRCGIQLAPHVVRERILKNWGHSLRTEIEGLIPEYAEKAGQVMAAYNSRIVSELVEAAAPVARLDTIAKFAGRYDLSIISGMRGEALELLVQKFGLSKYFREVISCEGPSEIYDKPSGHHLRRLLAAYSLKPEQVLCIGDGRSDILMAKRCGCRIIVVLGGVLERKEALKEGADEVVEDLHELCERLCS